LPASSTGVWAGWQPLLDTADETVGPTSAPRQGSTLLAARSVQLLAAVPRLASLPQSSPRPGA
jgi:hypothetical protein